MSSCDSIDNTMVEYVNKIDELMDVEKKVLDLYKTKLTLLNPEYTQEIEITRNRITDHTNTYLFLISLKTDYYELVRHCVFDSQFLI
jgi:hypothetical protein